MTDVLTVSIRNDFQELPSLDDEAKGFLESRAISPKAVYRVRVALEEIMTNTIKYGYDDQASHEIKVSIEVKDAEVIITCMDDGREFDPLSVSSPDTPQNMLERNIGGLGLHFVRHMTDSIAYRRDGDKNVLVMRIKG